MTIFLARLVHTQASIPSTRTCLWSPAPSSGQKNCEIGFSFRTTASVTWANRELNQRWPVHLILDIFWWEREEYAFASLREKLYCFQQVLLFFHIHANYAYNYTGTAKYTIAYFNKEVVNKVMLLFCSSFLGKWFQRPHILIKVVWYRFHSSEFFMVKQIVVYSLPSITETEEGKRMELKYTQMMQLLKQ